MNSLPKPLKCSDPNNFPNKHYIIYDWENRKTDSLIFMQGHSLPYSEKLFPGGSQDPSMYDLIFGTKIPMKTVRKYGWLPNTFDSPLVSHQVLDILKKECPQNIQAFPCEIHATDGVIKDYWIINIITLVDAIDKEKSIIKYDKEYNRISHIYELAFKPGSMGNNHLSRIIDRHSTILMSEYLATIFQKNKIKGISFFEDKNYWPEDRNPLRNFIRVYNLGYGKQELLGYMNGASDFDFFMTSKWSREIPKDMLRDVVNQIMEKTSTHFEECKQIIKEFNL